MNKEVYIIKSIIYRNPLISAILLDLFAMFFSIYVMKHDYGTFNIIIMMGTGILNRKIIENGIDMNRKKKTLIFISLILMVGVLLLYNDYIYNIRINEIINK